MSFIRPPSLPLDHLQQGVAGVEQKRGNEEHAWIEASPTSRHDSRLQPEGGSTRSARKVSGAGRRHEQQHDAEKNETATPAGRDWSTTLARCLKRRAVWLVADGVERRATACPSTNSSIEGLAAALSHGVRRLHRMLRRTGRRSATTKGRTGRKMPADLQDTREYHWPRPQARQRSSPGRRRGDPPTSMGKKVSATAAARHARRQTSLWRRVPRRSTACARLGLIAVHLTTNEEETRIGLPLRDGMDLDT